MTATLQIQVENRKRELISEILHHKKNPSRFGASEEVDKLKLRLDELADILRDCSKSWANLRPDAKLRLDAWMAR